MDEKFDVLNELGYQSHTYQENNRIRYMLNGVELDIDSWPYIPTYLEIEGKSEKAVNEMLDLLEVDLSKVTTMDVQGVFKNFYHIDIASVPVVRFDEPLDKKYYLQ